MKVNEGGERKRGRDQKSAKDETDETIKNATEGNEKGERFESGRRIKAGGKSELTIEFFLQFFSQRPIINTIDDDFFVVMKADRIEIEGSETNQRSIKYRGFSV